jgi:hypothetical protein
LSQAAGGFASLASFCVVCDAKAKYCSHVQATAGSPITVDVLASEV